MASADDPTGAAARAVAMGEAAAAAAVAAATAATVADVAAATAAAALGDAQAEAGYELTMAVFKDNAVEALPALVALEMTAIAEGFAAYEAEQTLAASVEAATEAAKKAAFDRARALYRSILAGLPGGPR